MKTMLTGIIACLLLAASCTTPKMRMPGPDQEQRLALAYKTQSPGKLDTFFQRWAAETPPLSDEAIARLSDTLQNVYAVFRAFYTPLDLHRLGGSEWGDSIYQKVHYLVLQDRIFYGFVDSLASDPGSTERPRTLDSILDFRPALGFAYPKMVVLTPSYDSLLNHFLGDSHRPLGSGNIMSPASAEAESKDRQVFLENAVKIWYGHWGGYWQLHSYPYAGTIVFDRQFRAAVVYFTMVYQGGFAYLKKENGRWTLIEAKLTWIE
jgi:hypothetical protein